MSGICIKHRRDNKPVHTEENVPLEWININERIILKKFSWK
jgi:hypothetical protein